MTSSTTIDWPLAGLDVIVTGATGLFGRPVCEALALHNRVTAVARFAASGDRDFFDERGITTVPFDLADDDLSALPARADVVFHLGATTMVAGEGTIQQANLLQVNAHATARLLSRYRTTRSFVFASSAAIYKYQALTPLSESSPLGLMNGLEDYALSKIVAEQMVQFLSREWNVPVTILRIAGLYSERGGLLTMRADQVGSGIPVATFDGPPNTTSALFEDDFVELATHAAAASAVPPFVVNFAGTEQYSVEEFCRMAADVQGTSGATRPDPRTVHPVNLNVDEMLNALGSPTVGAKEGIARVVANPEKRLPTWAAWAKASPGSEPVD